MKIRNTASLLAITGLAVSLVGVGQAKADFCGTLGLGGTKAAIQSALKTALSAVAPNAGLNGGLGNEMWATLVDRDGVVCAVAFTGDDRNDQWPGSRVISAQGQYGGVVQSTSTKGWRGRRPFDRQSLHGCPTRRQPLRAAV